MNNYQGEVAGDAGVASDEVVARCGTAAGGGRFIEFLVPAGGYYRMGVAYGTDPPHGERETIDFNFFTIRGEPVERPFVQVIGALHEKNKTKDFLEHDWVTPVRIGTGGARLTHPNALLLDCVRGRLTLAANCEVEVNLSRVLKVECTVSNDYTLASTSTDTAFCKAGKSISRYAMEDYDSVEAGLDDMILL